MKAAGPPSNLTVFHVTHWKAGSQWIRRILTDCAPERIIPPELGEKQFLESPIVSGAIYPTVYVTKEQFYSVSLPEQYCKFVVIRDLRDTLISAYFSVRYSHRVLDAYLEQFSSYLAAASVEDGLMHLLEGYLPPVAAIQQSWIEAGEGVIRYEDLVERDVAILKDVLLKRCQLAVSSAGLRQIVEKNRFEKYSGGRGRGEEDVSSHERKGTPGDWRNYFTRPVAHAFNKKFGQLLVHSGYEPNDAWVGRISKAKKVSIDEKRVVASLATRMRAYQAERDAVFLDMDDQVKTLTARLEKTLADAAELREFQTSALTQINTLTAMVQRADTDNAELRKFQASALDQINTLTTEINRLRNEDSELRAFQSNAIAQVHALTAAVHDAQRQTEELRRQLYQLSQRKAD